MGLICMEYPFVSVVVGIRNEERFIEECIESLLSLDYPQDSYEIIIVDGMSTDRTRDIVQKYPVSPRNAFDELAAVTIHMERTEHLLHLGRDVTCTNASARLDLD